MNLDDKKIRQLYRDLLRNEASRPEINQDKKEFISKYFEIKRPFVFRPAFAVPLMLFIGFFVFTLMYPRTIDRVSETPEIVRKEISERAEIAEVPGVKAVLQIPDVEVRRISSQMGPTMVYQKMYQEVPMTIVWVFPKESPLRG